MNLQIFLFILIMMAFIQNTYTFIPPGHTLIECTITPRKKASQHHSHPHMPGQGDKILRGQISSGNWGGYAAAVNMLTAAQNSVTAVYGSWIVPTLKATSINAYTAIWVGIDGYSSSTVEQIGTSHDWIGGIQRNSAWFEMYPRASFEILGFPVRAGDVISASVVYAGSNTFILTISNNTRKVTTIVPTSYTRSSTAKRSSAEWIVEAPWLNGTLPLSNFNVVYMWGCRAMINSILDNISNSSWQNNSIKMVTNGSIAKATPSAILQDNGSFFMTWNHL